MYRRVWLILLLAGLVGCSAPAPPKNQENLCDIFREQPKWYRDAKAMEKQWGTPMQIAMAFVKQESSFRHDARPPKKKVLWVIPWGHVSSAYGYAQAQDPAWQDYQSATRNGGKRTNFADAMMFIGWYTDGTQRQLGISKWDAYHQYLAYHEGRGGYRRGTYNAKPNLIRVARRVEKQANDYGWQLKQCRDELEKNSSWWPF
ncbi:hypothetical protein [Thaumasiovibrio sp. DFM-14]|uniref:transglycosylase SLT domain-containing protein n=1 Tax=Thaumasiovibrio sp. DFM-14 TaxID=3384792 RepID=UPI0039A003A9